MAKATRHATEIRDDEDVVITDTAAPEKPDVMEIDPEELIRVEAITDGTYPDFLDPRREPWYAVYRTGRVFNGDSGLMMPGEVFWMKRADAASAVHEKGRPEGWVRILGETELPEAAARGERPVPSTTAPRGYGQGRRPGL